MTKQRLPEQWDGGLERRHTVRNNPTANSPTQGHLNLRILTLPVFLGVVWWGKVGFRYGPLRCRRLSTLSDERIRVLGQEGKWQLGRQEIRCLVVVRATGLWCGASQTGRCGQGSCSSLTRLGSFLEHQTGCPKPQNLFLHFGQIIQPPWEESNYYEHEEICHSGRWKPRWGKVPSSFSRQRYRHFISLQVLHPNHRSERNDWPLVGR